MPRSTAPWEVKREVMVKAEDKTDPYYGRKPEERIGEEYIKYGVINLDKPPGPTSHEVAAWIKRILNVGRVGHGGTLEAQKPEKSQGDRCLTHHHRRVQKNCSSFALQWERICVSYETSW